MSEIDRRRIWWLASYPKSGSTWVRMFVNAYVSGFPLDLNSAWQYATGDLQPQTYQLTAAQPITDMSDVDCVYYRPAVLLNHILSSHTKDTMLKTHHAKLEVDGIPLIPPRLSRGALYIVRDPRDVAISFADHLGVSIDKAIERMASNEQLLEKKPYRLFHFLASWSTHVDSWTVQNRDVRTSGVRYEDMVSKPKDTFQQILLALGLPAHNKERFQFALAQTKFDHLQALERDGGFREKGNGEAFFRAGKAGKWRKVLSAKQVRTIEQNHGETMRRWKYELTSDRKNQNVVGRVQSRATATIK